MYDTTYWGHSADPPQKIVVREVEVCEVEHSREWDCGEYLAAAPSANGGLNIEFAF